MKIFRVGGAVRDELLGMEPKDIDFVIVGATVEELVEQGFSQTVGADFPVFIKDGCEFALARTERKVGMGHTAFETRFDPTVTLEEDLMRRDLTINAMAQDIETGEIIDPFNGRADLERGLLRHVSPAFAEDPLRVLRVARFAARFGFTIAPETVKLMRHIVSCGELAHLTKERVWAEVSRAMMESQPQNFFRVLENLDAMPILFGTTANVFVGSQHRLMVMADSELNERQRWMGLFMDVHSESLANAFIRKMKMPNDIAKSIQFAIDFVAVDKGDPKELVSFMNRWKLGDDNVSRLREAMFAFSVIDSRFMDAVGALPVAVQKSAAMNLSSLPLSKQKQLQGPEIGQAINEMREGPFRDWIVWHQEKRRDAL